MWPVYGERSRGRSSDAGSNNKQTSKQTNKQTWPVHGERGRGRSSDAESNNKQTINVTCVWGAKSALREALFLSKDLPFPLVFQGFRGIHHMLRSAFHFPLALQGMQES